MTAEQYNCLRDFVEVYRNECAAVLEIQYAAHPTGQSTTALAQRVHRLNEVLEQCPRATSDNSAIGIRQSAIPT